MLFKGSNLPNSRRDTPFNLLNTLDFWRLLFLVLLVAELLFKAEHKLKQHLHLLIKNSLELSDKISACLEMACRNLIDVYLVNFLVPIEHVAEKVSFSLLCFD